jgi:hypothetical protein
MHKKFVFTASLAFILLGTFAGTTGVCAQTAPSVAVRAGSHADYDRIVFDWPRDVAFHVAQDGNQATITFDANADIKFSRDVQTYLTRARGFTAHGDASGHTTVSFTIAPSAIIKSFTSSHSVVLDISGKAAEAATAAPQPAPPAATQPVTAPVLTPPPGMISPAPIAAAPPLATGTITTDAASGKPQPLTQTAKPATATAPVKPAQAAPVTPPPVQAAAATVPPKKMDTSSLALSDTPTLVATLDPHTPTRVAIYQRAGVGYVIFERKLTLSPAALENGAPPQVDIQTIDLPKNSGYRFPVPPNSQLLATLEGTAWKIYLSRQQEDVPVTTSLVAQPDFALGARFLLPLPDAPSPVTMTDPIVGDNLIIVPLGQSEAFSAERHMLDFNILVAAQGLVIKPVTEKVIVRAVSDGIEITADGGLQLSNTHDTGASQQSASKAKAEASGKSIFDFATWGGKADETFSRTRQRLQQTIVDVPEVERNRARLELARFYFANGNGDEAMSMLNFLASLVPDLRAHADFMSLLGASEILANRPEDGQRDLSLPALADQPEVELWQAVAYAEQRDWQNAEERFAIREPILTGYPEPFFSRFFVLAIESALAMDKDHEAADWLNFVSNAQHSPSIDPALAYLRGALHAKAGRGAAAEDSWKEAAASRDQLYKVRAELALIDLGVSTASLTPAQAADRLEALRFAWRGDDLEVDILHRLGQFYIEAKNVKAGLNALSQAVTLYPTSPLTPKIRAEMGTTFHDVFLGDLGKKLSPLDALTLYQQYTDLMPAGKDGDAVMKNLSERLVAVDLLDQASSLLTELVKNRLQGSDKDTTALRLAGIRLLNHQPDQSIAALDMIATDTLPAEQQNQRILLHARALSELHREPEAIALLKDNTTQGAMLLRADIAMHGQNWDDAAKTLMDLVGPPPATGKSLTADQAGWLLNAAIAYALGNDQTGLDKLAIDYSAPMVGTPQNDTFRMLTQPEKTGQLRDLAAAQAQITQVDMFQGFLNGYRATPEAKAP